MACDLNENPIKALVDLGVTHNLLSYGEACQLGLILVLSTNHIKVVNSVTVTPIGLADKGGWVIGYARFPRVEDGWLWCDTWCKLLYPCQGGHFLSLQKIDHLWGRTVVLCLGFSLRAHQALVYLNTTTQENLWTWIEHLPSDPMGSGGKPNNSSSYASAGISPLTNMSCLLSDQQPFLYDGRSNMS